MNLARWPSVLVPAGLLFLVGRGVLFGEDPSRRDTPGSSAAPRGVVAWPAGPLEVRVAFDGPLDPAVAAGLAGQSIAFEEPGPPGAEPVRGSLRIAAARPADGGRTLVLATDPHSRQAAYTLTLPGVRAPGQAGPGPGQRLSYTLNGVEAAWGEDRDDAEPSWTGWWPQLDPEAVRARTAGSVEHERGLALLGRPGRLALRTLIALPRGKGTVTLASNGAFEASLFEIVASDADHRATLEFETEGEALELGVTIRTGPGGAPPSLRVSYHPATDATERPLPADRQLLPWTPALPPASSAAAGPAPELAGGDPRRGEALFYGDQAKCSACHKVRGRGGDVGPDLSRQAERDPAAIYRDIAEPSAAIHPDYVPYTVATKDGRVVSGIVRAEGADAIRVVDTDAKATQVPKSDIEELHPTGTSIMPVGLAGVLGEAGMRDLVAFLRASPEN
jgi:putative heme-binding domain-containing protein